MHTTHVYHIYMEATGIQYEVLIDLQKAILKSYYDQGMNTTAKEKHETIQKAADETGTTFEKVKVSEYFYLLFTWKGRLLQYSQNCAHKNVVSKSVTKTYF